MRTGESTTPAPPPDPPPTDIFDPCARPIATEPCDKPYSQYAFDAALKACVELPLGQCATNANDFNSPLQCMVSCMQTEAMRKAGESWSRGDKIWGCKVEGKVYGLGAGGIALAGDCNTCTCGEDGHLVCTKKGCGKPICPEGTQVGSSCAAGGSDDGCLIAETACLPTCKNEADCTKKSYSRCINGLCRNTHP